MFVFIPVTLMVWPNTKLLGRRGLLPLMPLGLAIAVAQSALSNILLADGLSLVTERDPTRPFGR